MWSELIQVAAFINHLNLVLLVTFGVALAISCISLLLFIVSTVQE